MRTPPSSSACFSHWRIWRRYLLILCAVALAWAGTAQAQIVTGTDWVVAYNLPSQTDDAALDGEFAVRDLLIAQIDRLAEGNQATLATFTLSGNSLTTGGAAPLLQAVSRALDRGATVQFIVDSRVDRNREFQPGLSLNRLARRRTNPMGLFGSPRSVLMHNKTGLFDFGADEKWVFIGSGNFTGAAHTRQWNVATLIRNRDLFDAVESDMAEKRAGRFGAKKSREHDRVRFRLDGSWEESWVRFAPYPGASGGRNSAEAEIRRLIYDAEEQILFAMHRFNRWSLRQALVAAANRGVRVTGVIPESDRGRSPNAISRQTARQLVRAAQFTSTNHVVLVPARASATGTEWDSGQLDLVHAKYAIIDPDGERPIVVHGPANWTASGLSAPDGNDETTLFLCHRGIAQAFLEQFRRMTGNETDNRDEGGEVSSDRRDEGVPAAREKRDGGVPAPGDE